MRPLPLPAVLAAAVAVAVAGTPAAAAPAKLNLAQLTARALTGPRAKLAAADTEAARAQADEADAARLPTMSGTGFFTASPEIRCVDADCLHTEPDGFALKFSGVFAGGNLLVTQPIYTFGKIAAARRAAASGVAARKALEDEAAGETAVEAARAYWGLKLARELHYMLDDGIEEITKAKGHLDERLAQGSGDVTIEDQKRVATLLAEAKIQLEEATEQEEAALAAVRALAGSDDVDIDDDPLDAVTVDLGTLADYARRARHDRPQVEAADAGARAAHSLAELERRKYFPDLAVVGSAGWADAQGVDRPPGWIFSQPYHQASAGLALVLRWNLEPWMTAAKAREAEAKAHHADALAEAATVTATLEVRRAYAEASRAKRRVAAARDGEKASRAWVAAVLQNDAIGTADAKDIADSYIAWFQMRARLENAIFQWNVATVRLARATGEFHAKPLRPKE